tara:strand:+ start:622 stop:2007 length:1386 start_codon:yes stop_codon:yes gene_type:complete
MKRILLFGLLAASFALVRDVDRVWADVTQSFSGSKDDGPQIPVTDALQGDAKVSELLGHAKHLIAGGDAVAARKLLAELDANPNVADVDVLIADLMFNLGQSEQGQRWLEQASVDEPERLAIYLAFIEQAVQQRRWFDGAVLVQSAEHIDPPAHWSDDLQQRVGRRVLLLKAICAEGRTDWTQARQTYDALLQSVPAGSHEIAKEVSLGLARSCFQLKDYQAALDVLKTLAIQDHSLLHPQQYLAQWYEQNDMIHEADQAYRNGIEGSRPAQRGAARLGYARFLLYRNRLDDALPLLQIPIDPSEAPKAGFAEPDRLFLQAVLARLDNRLADAQAILSKLHQSQPESITVAIHLAAVLVEHDDEVLRGRALQIAESTVRNASSSADAWATLAWVQFRLGDWVAADSSLARSLKLGNPSKDTLHFMSQLKRSTGHFKDADSLDRLYQSAKGPSFFGPARPLK